MNPSNDRTRRNHGMLARLGDSTLQMLDFGGVNDGRSSRNTPGSNEFQQKIEPERVWQSPSRQAAFVGRETRDPLKHFSVPIVKKPPSNAAVACINEDPLLGVLKQPYAVPHEICLPALNLCDYQKEHPVTRMKREGLSRPQLVYGGDAVVAPEITAPPKHPRPSFQSPRRVADVVLLGRNEGSTTIAISNAAKHHPEHGPHPDPALASSSSSPTSQLLLLSVDIGDGTSVPLVGSAETTRALHHNRCRNVTCSDCATFLYCVEWATMVLCPECRSISPIVEDLDVTPTICHPAGDTTTTRVDDQRNHTVPTATKLVGIGLTVEHVAATFQRQY